MALRVNGEIGQPHPLLVGRQAEAGPAEFSVVGHLRPIKEVLHPGGRAAAFRKRRAEAQTLR